MHCTVKTSKFRLLTLTAQFIEHEWMDQPRVHESSLKDSTPEMLALHLGMIK